jgi:heme-degrading monooxygenase HmoA
MSVLMVMEAPGATTAEYDRANEIMGIRGDADAPDGLVQHVAASDGDGLLVVDVWESEEALGRFFEERLGAALAEAGIRSESKPTVLPVHNALQGKGTDAGVLMLIEIDDLGPDAYDEMVSKMDAHTADGSNHPCVTHTAAVKEGGGILVADLWESPEAFGKFAEEQIGPAGAAVGLGPIEPRIVPVHNRMKGRAAQPAS